ncbi:MAG TPA: archaetidylserine decarboxylase [Dokdonella sp.]
MARLGLEAALQYALPHRFLSRIVLWATRWTFAPWKNFLIGQIVQRYRVDLAEAQNPDPFSYPHFNAFFTRALKPGARPSPAELDAIICPADGRISQAGPIADGRILQAKGQSFSAAELLGDDEAALAYAGGSFLTVYLSPRDYHRVHMPLAGELVETVHIPGRIFSVAPFAVASIPRLFARNERLVCHFRGEHGPFAVVLVGAMLVSGIETVWRGVEVPPYASAITRRDYRNGAVRLARGAEMGRFNMGSTAIVLLPKAVGIISSTLAPEQAVRVGERVGAETLVKM